MRSPGSEYSQSCHAVAGCPSANATPHETDVLRCEPPAAGALPPTSAAAAGSSSQRSALVQRVVRDILAAAVAKCQRPGACSTFAAGTKQNAESSMQASDQQQTATVLTEVHHNAPQHPAMHLTTAVANSPLSNAKQPAAVIATCVGPASCDATSSGQQNKATLPSVKHQESMSNTRACKPAHAGVRSIQTTPDLLADLELDDDDGAWPLAPKLPTARNQRCKVPEKQVAARAGLEACVATDGAQPAADVGRDCKQQIHLHQQNADKDAAAPMHTSSASNGTSEAKHTAVKLPSLPHARKPGVLCVPHISFITLLYDSFVVSHIPIGGFRTVSAAMHVSLPSFG